MAGPDNSDDFPDVPPPEVPEEFAAAYREAYRRALEAESAPELPPEPATEPSAQAAPGPAPEPAPEAAPETVQGPAVAAMAGRHRVTEYRAATPLERAREARWFVPVLAVLLVLALVLAGWLIGRLLGSGADEDAGSGSSGPTMDATSTTSSPSPPESDAEPARPRKQKKQPFRGPVQTVEVAAIATTCTMKPGIDSAGRRVDYRAENAVDGDPATAWRCDGDAIGERVVIRLPEGTQVAEVGLVPGYAKTDPASGVDRYAENNRITRVRWTLRPGVTVVQRLDPSPDDRDVQTIRVPRTASGRVILEVLAVEEGSRGSTAISEVWVAAAR